MFDWEGMERRQSRAVDSARKSQPGLPREQLVPGAMVTISPNLCTGDRSYCTNVMEVVARNEGHAILKVHLGHSFSGKPIVVCLHEHEFYGADHNSERQMVTAEQVKEAVQKAGLTFVENHDCGGCGVPVGYVIRGDDIFYRSGCGCSWSPDRPTTWQEAADSINMQTRNHPKYGDIAAQVAKTFGLELAPLAAAAD